MPSGKLESVRGVFVAMAGFDANVIDHLFRVARGTRNNVILMDKLDLITIFEGRMTLKDGSIRAPNSAMSRSVMSARPASSRSGSHCGLLLGESVVAPLTTLVLPLVFGLVGVLRWTGARPGRAGRGIRLPAACGVRCRW